MSVKEASKLVRRVLAHMLYKPSIQVAAGIFTSESGFLAMKRGEDEPQAGKWEFPGGTVERMNLLKTHCYVSSRRTEPQSNHRQKSRRLDTHISFLTR